MELLNFHYFRDSGVEFYKFHDFRYSLLEYLILIYFRIRVSFLQLIEKTAQTGKKELKYIFKFTDNYDQKKVSPEILFSLENKGFKTVICNAIEGFTICISWKEEKNDEIENNKKRKIQDEIIPKVQGGFSAFVPTGKSSLFTVL